MWALLLTCCLVSPSFQGADDKEKTEAIRKEIADLRERLAAKEAELAEMLPVKRVEYLTVNDLKPGTAGPFGANYAGPLITFSLRIEDVLDKNRAIVTVMRPAARNRMGGYDLESLSPRVLISNFDTSGLSDGKIIKSGIFRVLGTQKISNRTYAHVEPYLPKK